MTQIEDGFEDQMVMKPPAFIPYKPDGRNLPQRQADRWKRIQPLHSAPVHGTPSAPLTLNRPTSAPARPTALSTARGLKSVLHAGQPRIAENWLTQRFSDYIDSSAESRVSFTDAANR
jgi:hypothetical protein